MTKQQIKQQIREYFVEQYDYCLRAFERHFVEYAMVTGPRTITRTTKVFSYKKYLKQLPSLDKDVKTTLDYANTKWAKDNDGSPIYIENNNNHYIFDCGGRVPWHSRSNWEIDVDKWLDQKVEEMYHELYD